MDLSRAATVVIDAVGNVLYISASIESLLGFPAETALGSSVLDWIHPDDVGRALESLSYLDESAAMKTFPMVFRGRHADGHYVEFDMLSSTHLDDPEIGGIVLNLRSAEERTQYVEPIRAIAAGRSTAEVLATITGAVGRGGHARRPAFIVANRDAGTGGYEMVSRMRADDALTTAVMSLFDGQHDHLWSRLVVDRLVSVPARELPSDIAELLGNGGYSGIRAGAIGIGGAMEAILIACDFSVTWIDGAWPPSVTDHWTELLDVAAVAFERHRVHSQLLHAATHDPLTNLANRKQFFEQLERLRIRGRVAVLYIDLDEFKQINDHHGHAAGDAVLVEIAQRLTMAVLPGDLVARLGGDEFAIAVADASDEQISELVRRVGHVMGDPLPAHCGGKTISASIGAAANPSVDSADALVHLADLALLAAKQRRVTAHPLA